MSNDNDNWQRRRDMGIAHSLSQSDHAKINAAYPGLTRQHCIKCEQETGRCEEDEIRSEDGGGPFCEECWTEEDSYD